MRARIATSLTILIPLAFSCSDEGGFEEAGETVDEAVDDAADTVEEVADDVEDAIED